MKFKESWDRKYRLAKEFYIKNNHLLINTEYFVFDNGERINLGLWISRQRQKYNDKTLSQNQIDLLENIGMKWYLNDKTINQIVAMGHLRRWLECYEYAKKYYKEHGNLLVPDDYIIQLLNGKIVDLKKWLNLQSAKKGTGKLTLQEIEMLENIKMQWVSASERNWLNKYNIAHSYYKIYGNILVPDTFIYNSFPLGKWLLYQRESYKNKTLPQNRIDLLENIGMTWEKSKDIKKEIKTIFNDRKWLDMFWLAKRYHDENGGYESISHENNKDLFNWIAYQKKNYSAGNLSQNQIYLLEAINIIYVLPKEKTKVKSIRGGNTNDKRRALEFTI